MRKGDLMSLLRHSTSIMYYQAQTLLQPQWWSTAIGAQVHCRGRPSGGVLKRGMLDVHEWTLQDGIKRSLVELLSSSRLSSCQKSILGMNDVTGHCCPRMKVRARSHGVNVELGHSKDGKPFAGRTPVEIW